MASDNDVNANGSDNPAGDLSLTDADLDTVAGGDGTESLSCTGGETYCKGTCGIPWLTKGCCESEMVI